VALLDEDTLGALLHELGDSYPIPSSGEADTLRRAQRGAEERRVVPEQITFDLGPGAGPGAGTVRRVIRAHPRLVVAASLVVVLALAGAGVLWTNTSTPPRVTAGSAVAGRAPAHSPATPSRAGNQSEHSATKGIASPSSAGAAQGPAFSASNPDLARTPTAAAPTTAAPNPSNLPNGTIGQPARIEQTGSLDLTVPSGALSSTMTKLVDLADAYGGFVANMDTQSGSLTGSTPSGSVTLQIPVASFTSALNSARSLGKVSQLTTRATDVTGQYVDLQSRITALEASRQQYLTIMAKATSIGDVLAVQSDLDGIETQIEQLQGQLNVLSGETAYSTLTATVSEAGAAHRHHHRTPVATTSGWTKAWRDSLHGFAVGAEGLIRAAGPALFALLCLVALVFGGRLSWRRLQRRNL
jgi:hypothetical protein